MDEQTRGLIRSTLTDVRYAEAAGEDFEAVVYERLMAPLEAQVDSLEKALGAALEDVRATDAYARAFEDGLNRCLQERKKKQERIADLEAQLAEAKQWQPVEDGDAALAAWGIDVKDSGRVIDVGEPGGEVYLPAGYRLWKQVSDGE